MNITKGIALLIAIVLVASTSVHLQEQQSPKDTEIRALIAELYTHPWAGAENSCSPPCWNFNFTEPMLKILERGSSAQELLLEKINDPQIKEQVIMLLGGVGDEHAVAPIIGAMVAGNKVANTPKAERINLTANLALTNITVADVIWHHGGGIEVRRCPKSPKECWAKWWEKNKAEFAAGGVKRSRRYSNYPNYGIYKQQ
jgi:hypothetical protein